MSALELRKQMKIIQERITEPLIYVKYGGAVTNIFQGDVNQLNQIYGEFVGKAKAQHLEWTNQIISLDNQVIEYFQLLLKATLSASQSFALINLAAGKISELISFLNTIDTIPPEERVSKTEYDKLIIEKDELKKTVEIMVQYKGLPELNTLMETAKNHSLR